MCEILPDGAGRAILEIIGFAAVLAGMAWVLWQMLALADTKDREDER